VVVKERWKVLICFLKNHGINCIGVPVTIDNDVYGTENSIGFDTAVNVAVSAIDKIRDTADSHGQVFMIEVMGRTTGFIAMQVGIATGAEFVAVPETMTDVALIYRHIATVGKGRRTIVVVSEGDESGGAVALSNLLMECYKIRIESSNFRTSTTRWSTNVNGSSSWPLV
jgi:6-phosphofructokinase 1